MPGAFNANVNFLWAVDVQNKKEKKNQKKMEKWDYFEKNKNYLNPLPMDKIFFWSVFKTLNKGQEGFTDKSKAWKATFPMRSIREF